MARYRTRDGDMLDQICLQYYGKAQGFVEEVLAANPRLISLNASLPAGLLIELPELNIADVEPLTDVVRLWD